MTPLGTHHPAPYLLRNRPWSKHVSMHATRPRDLLILATIQGISLQAQLAAVTSDRLGEVDSRRKMAKHAKRRAGLYSPALLFNRRPKSGVEPILFAGRELQVRSRNSHIPPILPTDVIQRVADLAEAMGFDRFDQCFEDILAVAGGFLQVGQAVAVVDFTG